MIDSCDTTNQIEGWPKNNSEVPLQMLCLCVCPYIQVSYTLKKFMYRLLFGLAYEAYRPNFDQQNNVTTGSGGINL
jgi:hypothetical protein